LTVVAAIAATFIAACSSTLGGSGRAAVNLSPTSAAHGQHGCDDGWITAPGAPFCYPLPAGFVDYSYLSDYEPAWTYRTLVSTDRHDLLEVLAIRVDVAFSQNPAQLWAIYHRGPELAPGKFSLKSASPIRRLTVDGATAFRQTGTFTNGIATDTTTIYTGHTWAEVECQWLDHRNEVAAACEDVLNKMRVWALP
jgi:hypothetical protein